MPVQQHDVQPAAPTRRSRREAERRAQPEQATAAPTPVAPAAQFAASAAPFAGSAQAQRTARVPSYARPTVDPVRTSGAPGFAGFETPAPVAVHEQASVTAATPPAAAMPPAAPYAGAHPLAAPDRHDPVAEIAADEPARRTGRAHQPSSRAVKAGAASVRAEVSAAARSREKRRKGVARLGVLGALVGVTVVVPVTHSDILGGQAYGSDALADATLPTTLNALTATGLSSLPPASLVSADGGERTDTTASRAELREALPGCDGSQRAAGSNGQLAAADLCTLWDGQTKMRADAAVSLAEFNEAFVARFGADMCLSSGYRTLAEQRAVKAAKGSLAAAPGKSNHGWGLAVDLCGSETTGAKWTWLNENAAIYGWENPDWAKPGGSGPYERWHWEYTKGVQEDGEYYG
ncbi:M15 family metallopeptidase [Cellulomonas soli]|uniref:D-alanyl-D-alanine carboxypeptidase-like core domain-containing protein n=1 Tax=Cellulomonas soli TaxID=931535 RepID=A0A512PIN4_9CELL|nr:M15 family metallopeptidase [Cellulomonas soli]NYI57479.1 hypothetical protein [Cellulomonas soli]GEP71043.1 hypothetical protein CSO01_37580 [Cellulomonas soli]